MKTKKCSKCKQIKPYSEYHKSSISKNGIKPRCKECRIKDVSEYQKSEQGKNVHKNAYQRYRENHPNRRKAHEKVNNAVRDGKIPPISTQKCQSCNKQANHYHHYKGYKEENWLDIIPFCSKCHAKEH